MSELEVVQLKGLLAQSPSESNNTFVGVGFGDLTAWSLPTLVIGSTATPLSFRPQSTIWLSNKRRFGQKCGAPRAAVVDSGHRLK